MKATEINAVIEKLNEVLGDRGTQVLEHSTRVVYLDAVFDVIYAVIMLLAGAALLWFYAKGVGVIKECVESCEHDGKGIVWGIFLILSCIIIVILMFTAISDFGSIPRILDPQSYAVMDLLRALR